MVRFTSLLVVISLVVITGCSSLNHSNKVGFFQSTLNMSQSAVKTHTPQTRVGLALGGGGVRGFVHLGVLKALEEQGIYMDVVTGTSAGSIAAAFYANQIPVSSMLDVASDLSPWSIADIRISRYGFIKGEALSEWVNENMRYPHIESTPISLGITVTNLTERRVEIIDKGDIGQAVQMSSSIPGAFIPTEVNESIYVDGGVLSVVPVNAARKLGADFVVAVDIYCNPKTDTTKRSIIVAAARLQSCMLSESEIQSADVLIRPDYEPENMGTFNEMDVAFEAGYQAGLEAIPSIRALRDQRLAFKKGYL
jgi:NTE family protein